MNGYTASFSLSMTTFTEKCLQPSPVRASLTKNDLLSGEKFFTSLLGGRYRLKCILKPYRRNCGQVLYFIYI